MTMFDAYVVEKYTAADNEERSVWHQVGRARQHGDGKGMTLYLIPNVSVTGQIVLREASTKRDADGNKGTRQAPSLADVGLDDSSPLPYQPS